MTSSSIQVLLVATPNSGFREQVSTTLRARIHLLFGIFALFGLTGCGILAKDEVRVEPGFGPADVVSLHAYHYELSASPGTVTEVAVSDKREVWEVLEYVTDQPGTAFTGDLTQFHGFEATGLRFEVAGATEPFEITHVWLDVKDNLLIFPDGTALRTSFGSPLDFSDDGLEVASGMQPEIGG